MKIMVTGGAGYIGSHACVELLQAGYDLVVLDNFSNSRQSAIEKIKEITGRDFEFYLADLADVDQLKTIFSIASIDAVIHFAGLRDAGESIEKPLFYYHNNISGTINLCRAMYHYGVKTLIYSSSAKVYGMAGSVPITEDFPAGATNPYGRSKHYCEEILKDVHTAYGAWRIVVLRYFNPIGAHQSGLIGDGFNGSSHSIMPSITEVAAGNRDRLNIYGNDYCTPDGTCIRDYIHVADLAQGHLRALEYKQGKPGLEIFNLGTGKGYSVLELIHIFETVTGQVIPYRIVGRRAGDVDVCLADPAHAESRLGWKAIKTIEEMCADSWRWQQNYNRGVRHQRE